MITMKGSSLGMSFAPKDIGSSPTRDKTFLIIYLGLACYYYIQFLFSFSTKFDFTFFSLLGSLEVTKLRKGSKG